MYLIAATAAASGALGILLGFGLAVLVANAIINHPTGYLDVG
jgi:hypothetical protein